MPPTTRSASLRATSLPVPSIESDMPPRSRAAPSPFRPTIPVAVSAGYGSPGKLGSPSRRLRAQDLTGGDLAADVGSRLARLSEEPPLDDEENVVEEEEADVPPVEKKKPGRRQRGNDHVVGNRSFGIEAAIGRSAAVEDARPAHDDNVRPARNANVRRRESPVPRTGIFSTNHCNLLYFLAFWLLCIPFLAALLSITQHIPWFETAKSLATFGAFPAPSRFVSSSSGEYASFSDMYDLRTNMAKTSDLTSLRQDLDSDITNVRGDVTHLRSQVNTLSSNIPAKGASAQFAGGIPAHIVPSYGASRINHFSTNLGAVIDPYLTSPSRDEIIHYNSFILRWLYPKGESIPITYTPTEALSPWEDVGDCWCSPSSATSNGLAQVGVILQRQIIPTDLIIEHIEKDRTMDPDATPKEIELLIEIHDADIRIKIAQAARKWMGEDDWQAAPQTEGFRWETPRELDERWVKVGRWTYDMHSSQNVQSFRIGRWLGEFGEFGVDKVVVRTRSNWGNAPYTCFYRLKLFGRLV